MSEVQVGGIKVKLEADASGVTKGVNSAKTSLDSLGASSQKIGAALGAIAVGATAVAAAMAVAGKAMYDYTQQGLDMVDVQAKAAREIGSTINGLKTLKNAAEYAGVSTQQLYDSTRKLNDSLGKIDMGSKKVATALSKLKIKPEDILPLDVDQRFELIARRIKELSLGAGDVTAILTKLGMTGKNLVGFLSDGGQSIKDARLELEKFNMGVNAAQAARVEKYNDQVTRLKRIADSIKEKLAVQVSPYLSAIAQKIEDQISMDKKFDESLARAAKDIATFTNNFITSVGLIQFAIDTLADISVKVVDEIPVPRVDKLVTGQMSTQDLTDDLKSQNRLGKIVGSVTDSMAKGFGRIQKQVYDIGWEANQIVSSITRNIGSEIDTVGSMTSKASARVYTADGPVEDFLIKNTSSLSSLNKTMEQFNKKVDFLSKSAPGGQGFSYAPTEVMSESDYFTKSVFGKPREDIKPGGDLVWDAEAKKRVADFSVNAVSLAADSLSVYAAGQMVGGIIGKTSTKKLISSAEKQISEKSGKALSQREYVEKFARGGFDYETPYVAKALRNTDVIDEFSVAAYQSAHESLALEAELKVLRSSLAGFKKEAVFNAVIPGAFSLAPRVASKVNQKVLRPSLVSAAEDIGSFVSKPFSRFSEYADPVLAAGASRQAGISKIYESSLADIYKEDSISKAKAKMTKEDKYDEFISQIEGKAPASFDEKNFSKNSEYLRKILEDDYINREKYSELELELRRKSFEQEFKDMEDRLAFLTESFKTEQDLVEEKFSNNMATLQESFENGLLTEEEYLKNVEKLRENHSEVLAEIYAKDNEHEVRRQEEMLTRLEMMADSFKTEEELIREKLANEEVLLKESLDKKLIDEEYYNEMRVKINKDAQDRIDGIRSKEKQSSRAALKGFTSDLASMTATTAGENKKMFELNKIASIANAMLDAQEAISGAYKVGARIGGPGLGAAFAAAAGFAQFARINQIRSTSFGGGAAAAPSAAPASTPDVPSDVAGITGDRAGGLATIQIVGSENAMFTTEQVRGLIEQINEQVDKGMRIKVV